MILVALQTLADAAGRIVWPIKLGDLRVGRHRRLNPGEVGALFKLIEREPNRDSRARR